MKIRSKALYAYLLKANMLNGTAEEIARAKQTYRKDYKKQWKQLKRPRKEIRIEVTLKQFEAIKERAQKNGLPHTTYSRNVIVSAVKAEHGILRKDKLLKILQLVSMGAIAATKNTMPLCRIAELLQQAETLLLQYLKP